MIPVNALGDKDRRSQSSKSRFPASQGGRVDELFGGVMGERGVLAVLHRRTSAAAHTCVIPASWGNLPDKFCQAHEIPPSTASPLLKMSDIDDDRGQIFATHTESAVGCVLRFVRIHPRFETALQVHGKLLSPLAN